MIISETKNLERKKFKNLMEKSSSFVRKKVEMNVKLYIETFFKKRKENQSYWNILAT